MIFLLVIAVSFVTQKSSARHSAKIKDTTGIAPSAKQPRPHTFADSGDLLTFSGKELDEPGAESYSITWRKMGATPKAKPCG
jgi:hypothetical protein